jgi:hypothetical protein
MSGYYSLNGNEWDLLMEIAIYNDQLWKFIGVLYYNFKKIYFLGVTSLHPKFYKLILFLGLSMCLPARLPARLPRPTRKYLSIFEYIQGIIKEYPENMYSTPNSRPA